MTEVVLNFSELSAGDVVGTQYEESGGVVISSGDDHQPVMVFDTGNPTGGDDELGTQNLGNAIIVSEDGNADDPNDAESGGSIVFDFCAPTYVDCFDWVSRPEGAVVDLTFSDGSTEQIVLAGGADGEQSTVTIDREDVVKMEVTLPCGGAIDNITYVQPGVPGLPGPLDGIVMGTEGNDVIDAGYEGDPEGDKIDNDDGTNGTTGDEDVVMALGGDDVVKAGAADDTVYGGDGNDTLDGGAGNDAIFGEAGDDAITGGAGDDTLSGGDDCDTIRGGDGDDVITGGAGDDFLYGDAGDDVLDGGTGGEDMFGGAGNDTLINRDDNADFRDGGNDKDLFVGAHVGDVIKGGDGGDDCDTLDLTGECARVVITSQDTDQGQPGNGFDGFIEFVDGEGNVTGTATFENIEKFVGAICFTPGSRIATTEGEVPVEALREGDKVITRDNGLQEIRWIGQRQLSYEELQQHTELKPVLIRAGALGRGLPERDMMVSPQHRVLVTGDRTQLYFEEREVLVAAKHLIDGQGVRTAETLGTTYLHLLFDNHEVVLSDGAWTESFQPGDWSLGTIADEQRQEVLRLFPELATREGLDGYGAARRTLKKHEAALLRG